MKKIIKILLIVVSTVILVDLCYSIYINIKVSLFNHSVERTSEGYIEGTEPFEMGGGTNAILFVHGFNDSPALWKTWVPFFAEAGFYCRAVRLPGSSKDLEAKENISISNRIDFIKREFDDLKHDYDKVIVCSHSMGGSYAAVMTAEGIIEPDVLVLVAPMFEISTKRSLGIKSRYLHELGKILTIFTHTVENVTPMDIKDKSVVEDYPIHPFIPMNVYETIFELMEHCIGCAAFIEVPTIMIVASDDRVVNPEAALNFYENLSSNKKILIVDEDSGHVIPRDFDNLEIAEKVLEGIWDLLFF